MIKISDQVSNFDSLMYVKVFSFFLEIEKLKHKEAYAYINDNDSFLVSCDFVKALKTS